MAKTKENGVKTEESNVVTMQGGGLPAGLAETFERDAGQGVSTAQEDTIIPILGVLQAQSPQVNKRDPKYIEGAEAGGLMLGSLGVVWPGEVGVLFQPCHFGREYVRWRRREDGGGFVGRHATMPTEAREETDPENPQRRRWVMPDGTELVDTRYHFGYILNGDAALPHPVGSTQALFALSSTGHTFSRQWMTQMSNLRLPSNKLAPSRARQYLITTVPKSNAAGNWYGLKAEDRGWIPSKEQYDLGTLMYEAIEAGKLSAAAPEARTGSAAGDDQIPF